MNENFLWINEHLSLVEEGKLKDAKNLLFSKLPNTLYKYKPLNDYALNSVKYEAVWLSDLASLNDPYECNMQFNIDQMIDDFFHSPSFLADFKKVHDTAITEEEHDAIKRSNNQWGTYKSICIAKGLSIIEENEMRNELFNKWQETTDMVRKKVRLCSFSERSDSAIMWSHYADHHKGICVEYDFRKSNQEIEYLYPIFYTDNLFEYRFFVRPRSVNQFAYASIQKGLDWQYEKEWRIIFPYERLDTTYYYKVPTPKEGSYP